MTIIAQSNVRKVKNVLSIDTNAKTVKGQKYGYLTGILYLAPNTVGGYGNLCAMAFLAKCDQACLYTAGRGGFNSVQLARINKTAFFFEYYNEFMNVLVRNIAQLVKKAKRKGLIPLVRLNGTSDILWESKSLEVTEDTSKYLQRYHGLTVATGQYDNIMSIYKDVQFYDYTKVALRFASQLPKNYDLTFSYSGVVGYQKSVQFAIKKGARIAVVFRDAEKIPDEFMGMPVVSGDNSDIRHVDPQASIVALYAKGAARKDQSGFVVDIA